MNLINLQTREIEYQLERKRVKNINLRIRPNGTVYVSANKRVSLKTIEEFLRKKSDFILTNLDKYAEMKKFAPTEKEYVTGEAFAYLGRDLRLQVKQGVRNEINSDGVYLYLTVKNVDSIETKRRAVQKWAESECRRVLTEIVENTYPIFEKYGVPFPKLIFREMSSRWGSCQPRRSVITLNKRLLEVPRECAEYVVMHEFAHFIHLNHSKQFYEFLSTLMPDWKERKAILEKSYFYGG
jgi:predicted metal-dependent hydrolase